MNKRIRIAIIVAVIVVLAAGAWVWATAGQQSTDDAQVDAHVAPVAARVSGTVTQVLVKDNQQVNEGDTLVVIDPRDYQVALDRAKAELATAEADASVARAGVPITSTTATSNVSTARGGIEQAQAGIEEAQRGIDAANARLATAQAHQREAEANAVKTAKDVERLQGLLAKDEVSQQQYDAAVAAADAARAATDSARAQVQEAQTGIGVAQSQLMAARAGASQASAQLASAQTAPQQVAAQRARAASADAKVLQQRAAVQQAELNLQYATVKAPMKGIVSKKSVEVGQVVQPGQPLMTVIPLEDVWVTANFKETQLKNMKAGQSAVISVDAYGGRDFKAHVESLAAATGSRFSLLPPENATGNFVKVVQRVPVRIAIDEKQDAQQLLRPGMSVTAKVYTK
jgi:membrane fusion protein (multidrug efflux system)